VGELDKSELRVCFGPGDSFEVETDKAEEPGKYFHPLLATLVTGSARLMLAISEALILENGLEWAFCDTDSMAIAKADEMDPEAFIERAKSVCDWFVPLNPYEQKGSLFKIEEQNFSHDDPEKLEPLYCLAVSAKRYALFNKVDDKIVLRKASAHGLGHLRAPYTEADAPKSIPAPSVALNKMGVERWQCDLWYKIIEAELAGRGEEVDFSYHPALNMPAASRYGATTMDLLRWFKLRNEGKAYADWVKPFNFMLCFQVAPNFWEGQAGVVAPKRGRRPKKELPKPVAPFDKDLRRASQNAFDRTTGKAVSPDTLKTYRQALAQYHLSPEMKFENGDCFDRGRTVRRHIHVTSLTHIGKEANRWEQQLYIGLDSNLIVEYLLPIDGIEGLREWIIERLKERGERGVAAELGISRSSLRRALRWGINKLTPQLQKRITARPT
jgi:hypothetical protein